MCTADRHDTLAAYRNHHCRCPRASAANNAYAKRRRCGDTLPEHPATMTMRRLQALASVGWTSEALAPYVRLHPVSIGQIRRGAHKMVTGVTAGRVHKAYRKLHLQPGPSDRLRAHAARKGWERPTPVLLFLDIDEVAVSRACTGAKVDLRRGDRLDAVYRLRVHRGMSYNEIARLLNLDQRQIARDLADLGLTQTAGAA